MGVFQSCNVSFCEKLTNARGCVSRSVIVMERPCVGFPKSLPKVKSKNDSRCVLRYSRHRSFQILTPRPTVNQIVYRQILWCLVTLVRDKRRSFGEAHAWTLHHDNAPAHTALSIRQFLAERNIATLEHPHISPIWPRVTLFSFLRSNLFWREPIFLTSIPSKWLQRRSSKRCQKMPSKNVLNCGKGECTSVFKWKGITLKEVDFGIFQYF